jgi:hypothetical protein
MSNGPAQADLSYLNKPAVFRKFARKATEKSHAVLKSCWMILFTGGTFALLHSFDDLIDCKFYSTYTASELADNNHCRDIFASNSYFCLSVLLFIVYILTFYRFYVGNIRVFDMIYDEVFEFVDSLYDEKNLKSGRTAPPAEYKDKEYENLLRYSDNIIKWESFFLILTALIVVYLTVTPLNPLKFLIVYFALLVADIFWLATDGIWVKYGAPRQFDVSEARKFFKEKFKSVFEGPGEECEKMFPSYALMVWKRNNIWSATLILIILVMYSAIHFYYLPPPTDVSPLLQKESVELFALWLGAIAAFANCWVDLKKAWAFYHPTFSGAYERLLESERASSTAAARVKAAP